MAKPSDYIDELTSKGVTEGVKAFSKGCGEHIGQVGGVLNQLTTFFKGVFNKNLHEQASEIIENKFGKVVGQDAIETAGGLGADDNIALSKASVGRDDTYIPTIGKGSKALGDSIMK